MIVNTISHYHIVRELGRGGMGKVYLAEDTKLKRQVAVKFLPEHLTRDKENVQRFEREAEAAARLNHSNIVTIHDILEEDGQICIVMEYIQGVSLRTRMDQGLSDPAEIADIMKQICEGLAEAHQADIVHRDIKPENIMIDQHGRIKILDFGLAKLKGTSLLTKETSTLGTLYYMSPEQVRGQEIDLRSDIWSLGVLLYEMISKQRPFKGAYDQAIMYAVLNEETEEIELPENNDTLARLIPITKKALKKEKEERYQSVGEILEQLGPTENQVSPTKSSKSERPGALKRKIVLHSAIGLLLVLVYLIYTLLFNTQEDVINSIAVLPLDNLSGNPEEEFFADGMTEAIISELSKMNALRVISRTSVIPYHHTTKLLPEIAEELDVKSVIEGSVLRSGDRVRITAQLIAFSPERHLWTDDFEREYSDVLTISSDVAQAIAREIRLNLSADEQKRIAKVQKVHPEAHQLYLKAMYIRDKSSTKESIDKSINFLQQSLALDPGSALVYAALASTYIYKAGYGYAPRKDILPLVYTLASKALAIDSSLSAAYDALGSAKFYELKWKEGEALYRRAIALSPNNPQPHAHLGYFLSSQGRHEEAIHEAKLAYRLDPLSIWHGVMVGRFYYYAREYDRAINEYDKILELNPDAIFPQWNKAVALAQKGLYEQAIDLFLKRKVKSPGTNWALGYTYGVAGYEDKAREVLNFLLDKSGTTYIWPAIIAFVYIGLGDKDNAFLWLEKTYEEQEAWLEFLKTDPWFDSLRDDPRFHSLLQRMNFPD